MRLTYPAYLLQLCSLLLLSLLSACGGGAPDSAGPVTPQPVPPVYQVQLYADATALGSAGQTEVLLTAVVKDSANKVVAGQTVSFSSDSGTLKNIEPLSDDDGTATAVLSTAGNPANRTITVTATLGNNSDRVALAVQGTTLDVGGNLGVALNQSTTLDLVLTDSAGQGLANRAVTISSLKGNTVPASVTTNTSGRASVTVIGRVIGSDTLSFSALGASTTATLLTSSTQQFSFGLNTGQVVVGSEALLTAVYSRDGIAQANVPVSFSVSRGAITATATTNALGEAVAFFNSLDAGPVTVTAEAPGFSGQFSFDVIATLPSRVTLQSSRSTLAFGEQADLVATLRDARGNLVAGKDVEFTLTQDTTGGTLSAAVVKANAVGQATVRYTAGRVASGQNGVTVTARVKETPSVSGSTLLTVAQSGLAVALVQDNLLGRDTDNSNMYRKQLTAIVSDAAGNPVGNQVVEFRVRPVAYYKGSMVVGTQTWVPSYSLTSGDPGTTGLDTFACNNEDLDLDGFLDAGEDVNGNGRLDPIPGEIVTRTVVTDTNGQAQVYLSYARERSLWMDVQVDAYVGAVGTDGPRASRVLPLIVLVDDVSDLTIRAPNAVSPFGVGTSCTSAN